MEPEETTTPQEDVPEYEWHLDASDKQGHTAALHARISPQVDQRIRIIVQQRIFPYPTVTHLIRHALLRHLRWLERRQPGSTNIARLEAATRILAEEHQNQEFEKLIGDLERRVSEYAREGQFRAAYNLMYEVRSSVEGMPEGYWRTKYLAALERLFRSVPEPPAVSMNPDDMVEED